MFAITLDQVKVVGAIIVVAFVALSIASAWLMKTIAKKVILALLFLGLAGAAWTQRSQATTCVQSAAQNALRQGSADCTFFGIEIPVRFGSDNS